MRFPLNLFRSLFFIIGFIVPKKEKGKNQTLFDRLASSFPDFAKSPLVPVGFSLSRANEGKTVAKPEKNKTKEVDGALYGKKVQE